MRLPAISERIYNQLEKLRPGKGDAIAFEDDKYIVKECGLRYYVCYKADNPKVVQWVRQRDAVRWEEPVPENETADRDWRTPLLKRESSHRVLETEQSGDRGDTRESDPVFTS